VHPLIQIVTFVVLPDIMNKLTGILLFAFIMAGCSGPAGRNDHKPVILVSILPQQTFIQKIAGDDFIVSVLIPHGANPTTYSLLPGQMADITHASAWFRMGHIGFELSWSGKLIDTNPGMKVIDLSQGLDLIGGKINEPFGQPSGIDPHIWLSPSLVKKMALTMRDELIRMRPDREEAYNKGYLEFIKEIEETDAEIRELLEGYEGRKFISFHPSLSYFARDYGLEQLSIQQKGKEPTPSYLAGLVDIARSENIKVIYIQSDFDRENARMFAGEIGGESIQVWPLNPEWSDNLRMMARMIRDNF
jgi:zinc transport system substrate-binding protein